MGKNPAFQFYPGDWRRDVELHKMTWEARGIWAEMLACMWDAKDRGKLEGTHEELARIVGCTQDEMERAIQQLSVTKTADVTNCNGFVTVINRRMFREEKERKNTRLRVSIHRAKKECNAISNANITVPSSSSSSSSYFKYKEKPIKYDPRYDPGRPVFKRQFNPDGTQPGESLCPKCKTIFPSIMKNCPYCENMKATQ